MRESLFTNSLRRVTSGPFTGCVKPQQASEPASTTFTHSFTLLFEHDLSKKPVPGFCRSASFSQPWRSATTVAGSLRRSSSNSIRIETRSGSRSARTQSARQAGLTLASTAPKYPMRIARTPLSTTTRVEAGSGFSFERAPVSAHEIRDDIAAAPPQDDSVRTASQRPSLAQPHEGDRLATTVESDGVFWACPVKPDRERGPHQARLRSGSRHWSHFRSRSPDRRRRPAVPSTTHRPESPSGLPGWRATRATRSASAPARPCRRAATRAINAVADRARHRLRLGRKLQRRELDGGAVRRLHGDFNPERS